MRLKGRTIRIQQPREILESLFFFYQMSTDNKDKIIDVNEKCFVVQDIVFVLIQIAIVRSRLSLKKYKLKSALKDLKIHWFFPFY